MSFVTTPYVSDLKLRPQGQRYLWSKTDHWFKIEDLPRLKAIVPETQSATVSDPLTGEHKSMDDIRQSRVSWISPSAETAWLYEQIADAIKYHNQTYYNYDIDGIEALQFTEYPAGEGYYKPHLDWGAGSIYGRNDICLKISFSVQLSDPTTYDGGDFRICDNKPFPSETLREFGTIIVFPSWMLHEVTPVTRGTRRSLVGWCVGPDFR